MTPTSNQNSPIEPTNELRDKIFKALQVYAPVTKDGKIPILNAKSGIGAVMELIQQACKEARIKELGNLKVAKGRFSTSAYGLWVDYQINERILALQKQGGE